MPAETESDTPMETNTANEAQEDIVVVSSSDAEITVVSEPSKSETTTTASIAPKNKLAKVTDLNLLPWVEKYRPAVLGDLISHQDITSTIQKFIDMDQLPHLLFYGPPGTGKTSTILALVKQLYPRDYQSQVLELNASDDRGIGVVRERIVGFASTRTMFNKKFKFVILDEADAMTNDAQNALRRVMEKYTENTRFCLICNYLSKIIPAIQSRCTRFRFGPLTAEQMMPRIRHVIESEKVTVTEEGLNAILSLATGDMRRSLNILQSCATAYKTVDEESVYVCTGNPSKQDINTIVQWLLNKEFSACVDGIFDFCSTKGYSLQDIITQVHLYCVKIDFPHAVKCKLLSKMADIEERLLAGASEFLQLTALVASFTTARHEAIELAAAS